MPPTATHVCEFLAWDSEFFGRRIGRLMRRTLTTEIVHDAVRWSKAHDIECMYLLADASDPATMRLAHDHGFELTDIRVTLERHATGADMVNRSVVALRPAEPTDIPALRRIASTSHRESRFYYDRHFERDRCDQMFATWIEKSVSGYADHVLIASNGGAVAGYVTLHVKDSGRGAIGLFGVDAASRGIGIGSSLIAAALKWLRARDVEILDVATQARNIRAMRFYQRAGFSISDVGLWYHRWSTMSGVDR